MHWIPLTESTQLDEAIALSHSKPVAIFKHSTRCSVSRMVQKTLELDWDFKEEELPIYFLDLITYRSISNSIAERLAVHHESPQLIVLRDGKAVYYASHSEIDIDDILVGK